MEKRYKRRGGGGLDDGWGLVEADPDLFEEVDSAGAVHQHRIRRVMGASRGLDVVGGHRIQHLQENIISIIVFPSNYDT